MVSVLFDCWDGASREKHRSNDRCVVSALWVDWMAAVVG